MLRPQVLSPRRRRPRLLLCALLGIWGGLSSALLMAHEGHPLPARPTLTISRWALHDARLGPTVVELLERAQRRVPGIEISIE